jgi:ribose 1,5-bisphosphokinase
MSGAQEKKLPELHARDAERIPVASSAPGAPPDRAGRGTLVLIVGPSGSGKDTLLLKARQHFFGNAAVVFCERIITRRDQSGEKHLTVSAHEFEDMVASGGFFLSWKAHGLCYGIPASMLSALESGKTVIANGSRQIVSDARGKWPNTRVIHIVASREVLRKRLLQRGRETADAIEKRLERAPRKDLSREDWVTELDNSGALAPAARRFIAMIEDAISASTEHG